MKNINNPKLDPEEIEILEAYEKGDLESIKNSKATNNYVEYAKNTLNKTKNINIRLSVKDLQNLKRKAAETGLPYQTLISALLRQYTTNRITISL